MEIIGGIILIILIGFVVTLFEMSIDEHKKNKKPEVVQEFVSKLPFADEKRELEQLRVEFRKCTSSAIRALSGIDDDMVYAISSVNYVGINIFDYAVNNFPNKQEDLRKFINHYIPMTMDMINTYKKMSFDIDFIDHTDAKSAIEKSLESIYIAFQNIYTEMTKEDLLKATVNAEVLETILSQDGLLENMPAEKIKIPTMNDKEISLSEKPSLLEQTLLLEKMHYDKSNINRWGSCHSAVINTTRRVIKDEIEKIYPSYEW